MWVPWSSPRICFCEKNMFLIVTTRLSTCFLNGSEKENIQKVIEGSAKSYYFVFVLSLAQPH